MAAAMDSGFGGRLARLKCHPGALRVTRLRAYPIQQSSRANPDEEQYEENAVRRDGRNKPTGSRQTFHSHRNSSNENGASNILHRLSDNVLAVKLSGRAGAGRCT
jgi:hypothetical protein